MKTLRPHQHSAVTKLSTEIKGIINHPTGTGKSLIQSRSIVTDITDNPGKTKVYVVLSPRILLSNQLLDDVREDLQKNKIDCQYLVVNSGNDDLAGDEKLRLDMGLPHRDINSTTKSSDIRDTYTKAVKENVPLVISSTYHSAERIVRAGIKVDITYCDEAHYLVQEQFDWIPADFPTERQFFFTATLRETPSVNGRGMNNEERFGEIISQVLPVEAIQSGDLIRPRMHIVSVVGYEDDDTMDGSVVAEAFVEHNSLTNVGAKMLVITKGSEHLNNIISSNQVKRLSNVRPQLKIFDISTEYGARINGKTVTRKVFLTTMRNLTDADEAIIIHIDILTEGIDVPGITGVMPLNGQGKAKFLQTLGRATRLHPLDRTRIWDGGLDPTDTNEMTKPYAWVIIPAYGTLGDDLKDNIRNIVGELRSFGFNPSEDVVIRDARGKSVPVPLDMVTEPDRKIKQLTDFMGVVLHDVESEDAAHELKMGDFRAKEWANTRTIDQIIDELPGLC